MIDDVRSSAAALYDGGWRSDDIEELIEEYELTEEEATDLMKGLIDIEEMIWKCELTEEETKSMIRELKKEEE